MSCIGNLKRMILCHISRGDYSYVLEGITKEQEDNIDNTGTFIYKNGDLNKKINIKDIPFYGEIDINNEEDINIIQSKNLVDVECVSSMIPTDFNYDTGYYKVECNVPKMYPTINPVEWFKYVHCRLGKPKRVVAYKILNKLLK